MVGAQLYNLGALALEKGEISLAAMPLRGASFKYRQPPNGALVESEKSTLIASHFLLQYPWIATGGKNGAFNKEAMSLLKNRLVLLFPDLGATDYWRGKMEMMQRLGIEVSLFDFMENNASDEERKRVTTLPIIS